MLGYVSLALLAIASRWIWLRRPRTVADRLKDLTTEVVIDNHYYDGEFSQLWHHPNNPLKTLNAARVPYFISQLDKLGRPRAELKVLDVGCGGGLVTEPLANAGFQMTGIDLSPRSIAAAQAHAESVNAYEAAQGHSKSIKINYVVGSAYKLPFDDASFDAVVSSDVIEHMHDLMQYCREIARVLKPGGCFTMDTINRTPKSYLTTYLIVQELFGIIPCGTHAFELFVTPVEIERALRGVGLKTVGECIGMEPTLRLGNWVKALAHGLDGAPRRWAVLGDWVQTRDIGASYLWTATK